ncbi:MAG TPA: class I SAM-dependent methyltransferase [Methylomirabilota bacterium]|jgi:SAM-dependent methyltransferase
MGRARTPAGANNDWYRFYAPRRLAALTAERILEDRARAERDLDAVLARTGLSSADRILEIGCGWGRHSLALARRGFGRVVSVDIAPEPLGLARALAREAGLDCDLRQQDFSLVDDGPYAAVLSLYDRSVCGFPSESEDARSLRHLAGLLEPGGWLVFGIDDWPRDLPEASERRRETAEGLERIEVVPEPAARTCTHRVTLAGPDGREETHALTRRHYSLPELRQLLTDTGFAPLAALHRLAAERLYAEGGEGLFVYARRA